MWTGPWSNWKMFFSNAQDSGFEPNIKGRKKEKAIQKVFHALILSFSLIEHCKQAVNASLILIPR